MRLEGSDRIVFVHDTYVLKVNKHGKKANEREEEIYRNASLSLKCFLPETTITEEGLTQERVQRDEEGLIEALLNSFPLFLGGIVESENFKRIRNDSVLFLSMWVPIWMCLSFKKQGVENINSTLKRRLQTYQSEMGLDLSWIGNLEFNLEELTPLLDLDLEVIQDLHPGNLGYKNQQFKIFDFAGTKKGCYRFLTPLNQP